jgi:hypothetical protein
MVSSPDVSLQHFNAGCQYTFPPQWAIKKIGDNNSNTKIEKKWKLQNMYSSKTSWKHFAMFLGS